MKSMITLLAVAGLVLSHAEKLRAAPAKPKTAFCMTGNVRANHAELQSRELRRRLDMIDPNGMVFAYVNPCEAQTEPWWWQTLHKGAKKFVPQKSQGDCWGQSFWRQHVKPAVMKEYRDADVEPVPRPCKEGAPPFLQGVYQQWKGVQECFKLVKEYEEKNSFKFETVARFRADSCHDAEGCYQVTYCRMDELDRQKSYIHAHSGNNGKPVYFDNFAILSRQHADIYFNALDIYFNDCTVGGAGEGLLDNQMWKHNVVAEDKCECHQGRYCPPPGQAVFIKRNFLLDLGTYRDTSMFMEMQPTVHFLDVLSENATSSEFEKPAYMRLELSASS
eukprot:TRINITY_DN110219_c0_g1_i1.p1 TRINITY_DN110219_c0_g1~~TRINITY_DN110219_c0_g1_i1.p1  ORF type:complete len:333 (+),score=61.16 TRINITY_DN110219_c0_g1_i1:98-1096(+)